MALVRTSQPALSIRAEGTVGDKWLFYCSPAALFSKENQSQTSGNIPSLPLNLYVLFLFFCEKNAYFCPPKVRDSLEFSDNEDIAG